MYVHVLKRDEYIATGLCILLFDQKMMATAAGEGGRSSCDDADTRLDLRRLRIRASEARQGNDATTGCGAEPAGRRAETKEKRVVWVA